MQPKSDVMSLKWTWKCQQGFIIAEMSVNPWYQASVKQNLKYMHISPVSYS